MAPFDRSFYATFFLFKKINSLCFEKNQQISIKNLTFTVQKKSTFSV